MKQGHLVMVALFTALVMFAGCKGEDGKLYGEYDYPSDCYITGYLGGFPTGYISANTNYEIQAGTYEVYYRLEDSYFYYPSSSKYWYAQYTVTINKGAILQDGADKYFTLYLGYYGLSVTSGDATITNDGVTYNKHAPLTTKQESGSQMIWTSEDGAVTVTVTNEIVQDIPANVTINKL